jgi:hypothetical protein
VARVLENSEAVNQHAAAAKVLSVLLDKLCAASARGRRGGLAVVRDMTKKTVLPEGESPHKIWSVCSVPARGWSPCRQSEMLTGGPENSTGLRGFR